MGITTILLGVSAAFLADASKKGFLQPTYYYTDFLHCVKGPLTHCEHLGLSFFQCDYFDGHNVRLLYTSKLCITPAYYDPN